MITSLLNEFPDAFASLTSTLRGETFHRACRGQRMECISHRGQVVLANNLIEERIKRRMEAPRLEGAVH